MYIYTYYVYIYNVYIYIYILCIYIYTYYVYRYICIYEYCKLTKLTIFTFLRWQTLPSYDRSFPPAWPREKQLLRGAAEPSNQELLE